MKRWSLVISLLFILFACSGCKLNSAQLQEFSDEKFVMDTLVQVTVYSDDKQSGKEALDKAFAEFKRINDLTDRFPKEGKNTSASSDVIRINENAGIKPVQVGSDTLNIVQRSLYYAQLSGGSFDITVGPIMDLWGFGKDEQHVPSDEQIKKALSLVDYRKVIVDADNGTVYLQKPGMSLDFGGVAKGYATEEAAKILRELGIKHAIINAGGNVYALGARPDGSPWRVGVRDPRDGEKLIAVLSVKDTSVVTSGDYERYFEQGGVRYSHLIDPSTGKQARDLIQTTVVAESSTDADILNKPLFVLGQQRGMSFAKGIQGVGAIFVNADKQVTFTDNLANQLEFTGGGDYQIINQK
ncbi:FAD:protein FMN transferase [Pelotomaculum sp. PtaB.Bin117]|uniref:FAD:protein FMN transferase n=2 Tax=Pelotomaculum TaxID=191373 RepID=UPI0009C70EA2|nr:FAD:protein FMN transferase [Pelotomaculum sp. PtaB.Bin117]OPX91126.1 MAG: Thiamine biosynthesis lipoprotein ApbE precursor [Pelotomaculum sp. PtaB.Bin117]OPY61546.1 MAG: Thiamine biosynthesis lipoprotein ApbE precursor [Pelotomaculum sp. PtaU1.Bin065]